jgi:hypothetical protein
MDGGTNMDGGDTGARDAGDASSAQDSAMPVLLTITSATPAAGSSTTANVAVIEIVFSEPVNALRGPQLRVSDGSAALGGSLMTSGDTVTFKLDRPLTVAGSYEITISGDVTARESGAMLGEEQHWTFAIAAGFAHDAQTVDRASTPGGSRPAVAVDADGNAIVAWVQDGASSGSSAIWYARYSSGYSWSSPNALSEGTGQVGPPSVAMAADGTAFVAWTQWSGVAGANASVLARSLNASGISTLLDSDPDTSAASMLVGIGTNAAGHARVAWVRGADASANGAGHLFFAAFDQGSWSSAVEVLDAGGASVTASGELQVAVASTGLAAIGVFANTDATLFVQQTGSANWALPFRDYDYTNVRRMAVAVDPADAFYAGCHDPEGGGNEVARVAGSAVALRSANVGNNAYTIDPKFSIAADGDAVAAFLAVHEGDTTVSVQALAYNAGVADWEANASDVFPQRSSLVPSQPDVAVYGNSALIAWEAGGNLYTVERAPDRSYGEAIMRDRVGADVVADSVQVAAASNGTGMIVWAESTSPPRIAAQTFRGVR